MAERLAEIAARRKNLRVFKAPHDKAIIENNIARFDLADLALPAKLDHQISDNEDIED